MTPVNNSNNQRDYRELNIMNKISQEILKTLDYEEILQIISDGMSELLEIESAAIYILEDKSNLKLSATTPPLDPGMPEAFKYFSVNDHPYIKKTIQSRKAYVITDTKKVELSPAEKEVIEMRHLQSLLFFPFVQEKEVLGTLILGTCNKARKYSKDEINLAETLANQLAVSIQNARLHEDLKVHKENLEKLVKEKTKSLDEAIVELKSINDNLFEKNEIINEKNMELQKTLQNLQETQAQLLQSEKMASLGVLTSGVAHEINNPLNYISGSYNVLYEMFCEKEQCEEEEISNYLENIKIGIERISKIVNSLNDFTKDSKSFSEKCNVPEIIDNCLIMLNSQIRKDIVVDKVFAAEDVIVPGNLSKLHQAFLNIIQNAVQSIKNGGRVGIRVSIVENKKLEVVIEDNGVGISAENITKVSDPFFTTKDPGQGVGLGLSITYNIIKEHKGVINFDSIKGKGTRVMVELPIFS